MICKDSSKFNFALKKNLQNDVCRGKNSKAFLNIKKCILSNYLIILTFLSLLPHAFHNFSSYPLFHNSSSSMIPQHTFLRLLQIIATYQPLIYIIPSPIRHPTKYQQTFLNFISTSF